MKKRNKEDGGVLQEKADKNKVKIWQKINGVSGKRYILPLANTKLLAYIIGTIVILIFSAGVIVTQNKIELDTTKTVADSNKVSIEKHNLKIIDMEKEEISQGKDIEHIMKDIGEIKNLLTTLLLKDK